MRERGNLHFKKKKKEKKNPKLTHIEPMFPFGTPENLMKTDVFRRSQKGTLVQYGVN